jgi:hypothetical protein
MDPVAAPAPAVSFTPTGLDPDWPRDRMRPEEPRWKGTGHFIIAGLLATSVFLKQMTLTGLCGVGNCDLPGVTDRVVFAGALGAAMGGAARRGRWDAARDVRRGNPRDLSRRAKVGLGLAGAGLAIVILDSALNGACYLHGAGPYVQPNDEFSFIQNCRTGVSTALIDVGFAATAVGFPMAIHARVYRRHVRARTQLSLAPMRMPGGGGITVSGRF